MDSLLIIIVLYKKTIIESASFVSIQKQLKSAGLIDNLTFYFYDNSPTKYNGEIPPNCFYVHDKDNGGVSKAYNWGAKFAKKNGIRWLLLLDQDTAFPVNYLEYLSNAIKQNSSFHIFVPRIFVEELDKYISPGRVSLHRTIPHKNEYKGVNKTSDMSVINSGLCISTNLFWQVGGYEEQVYLDFSDTCFWEKVRKYEKYFYILDINVSQDFSALERDSYKARERFKHYCVCARNYPKSNFLNKLTFLILIMGKTIKMSLRYKSIDFFKIMTNKYFII